MIETLADIAETDDSYAKQYRYLLSWLEFAGLIATDGGTVKLTDDASPSEPSTPSVEPVAAVTEAPTPAVAPTSGRRTLGTPIVSLSFDIAVTAEDLAKLTPEQIASLFDGIGKVAAVRVSLDQ
jgi:hypothetical protein